MDISRRALLKAGAVWTAIAAFPSAVGANLLARERPLNTGEFCLATFEPYRGEIFGTSHEGAKTSLRLVEINNLLPQSERAKEHECFSLVFHGRCRPRLSQGTYDVEHPALGTFPLFIVPVNQPLPDGSACYEAIFNLRKRAV